MSESVAVAGINGGIVYVLIDDRAKFDKINATKECMDARRPPSESRTLFLALSARAI